MWYFSWILGVTAALAFGVINVMWYEFQNAFEVDGESHEGGSETAHARAHTSSGGTR
ncbi:MAG: cytochrome bd-I oxidase subunit CydX [Hyphomicrobiaceae bacterium]